MRYEDGLAARVRAGDVSLTLMALAHIGGFAERLPGWLAASQQKYPEAAKVRQRIFDALQTSDIATIEAALREPDIGNLDALLSMHLKKSSPSKPDWLDQALPLVDQPIDPPRPRRSHRDASCQFAATSRTGWRRLNSPCQLRGPSPRQASGTLVWT
jgi:hypothetical protein